MQFSQIKQALPATRPPFLVLAPICVLLGLALANEQGLAVNYLHALLAFSAALFSAIAVNTLNEFQDFHSGLDLTTSPTPFSGGSGLLKTKPALANIVFVLTLLSLAFLLLIGLYFANIYGANVYVIGILGIMIIVSYTKVLNRQALLCYLAPGVGFGLLIVLGTLVTQGGSINHQAVLIALIPSVLISNLLLANQFPDISADKTVGRHHLAIAIGEKKAAIFYLIANLTLVALVINLVINNLLPLWCLLTLLPLLTTSWVFYQLYQLGENIGENPSALAINVIITLLTPVMLTIFILFR